MRWLKSIVKEIHSKISEFLMLIQQPNKNTLILDTFKILMLSFFKRLSKFKSHNSEFGCCNVKEYIKRFFLFKKNKHYRLAAHFNRYTC